MKSQLLQDINESASRSQSWLFGDALFPKADGPAAASPAVERPEPEVHAHRNDPRLMESDASGFASERVDWVGRQIENEPHWFDRWGRQAATWSACLVMASLLAGGGLWLYRESRIDSTLVLVAENSLPARQADPTAVMPTPAPAPATATSAEPDTQAVAPSAETLVLATPSRPVASKPLQLKQKRVSTRPHPKAADLPAELEAARTRQLADTLKQCRAMGYHAAQCLKRGCVMTKYGLACKG